MVTRHAIKVLIDRQGSVEVEHLTHGSDEIKKLAAELGLTSFHSLNFMNTAFRSEGLSPDDAARVKARAEEHGYEVEMVETLAKAHEHALKLPEKLAGSAEAHSTIEVLHKHSLAPSRREKMVIPLVVLAAVAVLAGIGSVIYDHNQHGYRNVGSLAALVEAQRQPLAARTGLAGIINPADDQYAAFPVRTWAWWDGKSAIVEEFYVHMAGIKQESIEAMVTQGRGAAACLFQVDLSKSEPTRFHVDGLTRGGMEDPDNKDFTIDVHRLTLPIPPEESLVPKEGAYFQAKELTFDSEASWKGVTGFTVNAYVIATEKGYEFDAHGFKVALAGEVGPGMKAMLRDLAARHQKSVAAGDRVPMGRAALFLTLESIAPRAERMETHTIGTARLDGVRLGKVYVGNEG